MEGAGGPLKGWGKCRPVVGSMDEGSPMLGAPVVQVGLAWVGQPMG